MQHVNTGVKVLLPLAAVLILGAGCPNKAKLDANTEATVQENGSGAKKAMVEISNQTVVRGIVVVPKVVSVGPGWLVIHADAAGKPGDVIGQQSVQAGENVAISVQIDTAKATPKLYAMLHVDAGTIGTYEFPGEDVPAANDSEVVNVGFDAMLDPNTSSSTAAEGSAEANAEGGTAVKVDAKADVKAEVKVDVNATASVKSFDLTAKKWAFEPSTITVNKGDKVKLSIKSVDVTHGFSVPDFGVNQTLKPGETLR